MMVVNLDYRVRIALFISAIKHLLLFSIFANLQLHHQVVVSDNSFGFEQESCIRTPNPWFRLQAKYPLCQSKQCLEVLAGLDLITLLFAFFLAICLPYARGRRQSWPTASCLPFLLFVGRGGSFLMSNHCNLLYRNYHTIRIWQSPTCFPQTQLGPPTPVGKATIYRSANLNNRHTHRICHSMILAFPLLTPLMPNSRTSFQTDWTAWELAPLVLEHSYHPCRLSATISYPSGSNFSVLQPIRIIADITEHAISIKLLPDGHPDANNGPILQYYGSSVAYARFVWGGSENQQGFGGRGTH